MCFTSVPCKFWWFRCLLFTLLLMSLAIGYKAFASYFSQFTSSFLKCETTKWNNCTLTLAITMVFSSFTHLNFNFNVIFWVYYIMKFFGHCNEYNFIRRNFVVHSKIWLNNSEALKQKILLLSAKFVCNVEICNKNCCWNKKNTYFVSQNLVCNFAK